MLLSTHIQSRHICTHVKKKKRFVPAVDDAFAPCDVFLVLRKGSYPFLLPKNEATAQ